MSDTIERQMDTLHAKRLATEIILLVAAVIWGSAVGLFFLSTAGRFKFNPGDGLELLGAFFYAN